MLQPEPLSVCSRWDPRTLTSLQSLLRVGEGGKARQLKTKYSDFGEYWKVIAVEVHYADRRFIGIYDEELEAPIYIGMALLSRDENQHDEVNHSQGHGTNYATWKRITNLLIRCPCIVPQIERPALFHQAKKRQSCGLRWLKSTGMIHRIFIDVQSHRLKILNAVRLWHSCFGRMSPFASAQIYPLPHATRRVASLTIAFCQNEQSYNYVFGFTQLCWIMVSREVAMYCAWLLSDVHTVAEP